jgi:HlyD family secretion protein
MSPIRRAAVRALVLAAAATAACQEEQDPDVVRASGHVEATEVRVSAKVGGSLDWFEVDEGDRVERGQELARFSTVDQELALAAARAERDLADANLRLAAAGFRAEDVDAARAQLRRAEVELAAAERDLTRFQGLLDSGSGTEKASDDALTRRDAAARTVDAAGDQLRKLERGLRDEEVDAARARVDGADARIAQIEQQIRDATVTSPAAGEVTAKLVEPGEILPPGTALAVVTDLADARLVAYVGEPDLGRIRLGQEVEVTTDGGERRTGRLTWISPRAEFTPKNVQTRDERVKLVYKVKVALPNDDGLFKPGMPAEAILRTQGTQGTTEDAP